jgi:hypothetical protein
MLKIHILVTVQSQNVLRAVIIKTIALDVSTQEQTTFHL